MGLFLIGAAVFFFTAFFLADRFSPIRQQRLLSVQLCLNVTAVSFINAVIDIGLGIVLIFAGLQYWPRWGWWVSILPLILGAVFLAVAAMPELANAAAGDIREPKERESQQLLPLNPGSEAHFAGTLKDADEAGRAADSAKKTIAAVSRKAVRRNVWVRKSPSEPKQK